MLSYAVENNRKRLVITAFPPLNAFGLWISEFGYDNWNEIKTDLQSLVENRFPVDGIALDLQWFGGSFSWPPDCKPDRMGTLKFNLQNFPSPEVEISKLQREYGVRVMTIEEPHVDNRLAEYQELWDRRYLARIDDTQPVTITGNIAQTGNSQHCMWWGARWHD